MTLEQTLPICIAGQWRSGRGERYATCYPATGAAVAWLNASIVEDVEDEVQGANEAFLLS